MRKSAGNGAQSTESIAQSKSESSTNRYAFRSNTETNTSRAVTSRATNRRIIRSGTGSTKPGRKKAPSPFLKRRLKVRRKSEGRRRT